MQFLASWILSFLPFMMFDAANPSPALFSAQRDYAIPTPYAVVMEDFNGDSKLDLAMANFYGQSITVIINGGGSVQPYPVGQLPNSLAVADFNGDLRPDLVIANGSSASVSGAPRQRGRNLSGCTEFFFRFGPGSYCGC